jgi:hypothetical protein
MSAQMHQTSHWSEWSSHVAPDATTPRRPNELSAGNRLVRFLVAIPEVIAGVAIGVMTVLEQAAGAPAAILLTVVVLLLPVLVFAGILQAASDLLKL